LHGWDGVSQRLTQLQRTGDMAAMAETITDEMLDVYAVTGTWDELPGIIADKYRGIADRLLFYFANDAWEKGPQQMERWQDLIARTRELASRAS
jgi:23S rRNA G2069 N7-methylase RlmK/C1962 C5-methylase RlmI